MTTGPGMAASALRPDPTRFGGETPGLPGRRVKSISIATAHPQGRTDDGWGWCGSFSGRVLCAGLQVAPSLCPAPPRGPRRPPSCPLGGIGLSDHGRANRMGRAATGADYGGRARTPAYDSGVEARGFPRYMEVAGIYLICLSAMAPERGKRSRGFLFGKPAPGWQASAGRCYSAAFRAGFPRYLR